jgi:hypothetical protein
VLSQAHFVLDGDEAVSGIIALRLSLFQDFPIFFYGQAYMAPTDGWFAAPFIGLGSGWTHFAPFVWSVGLIWLNYLLAVRFFESKTAGLTAAALTAAPSLYFLVNTLRALGSFTLILVLGNLLLLVTYYLVFKDMRHKGWLWAVLGGLVGFSFYVFWLVGFYYLPVIFFLFLKDKLFFVRRTFSGFLGGFFAGSLPFWGWNAFNDWGTFRYFFEPKPGIKPPAGDILNFFFSTGLPLIAGSQNYWFLMSRLLGLILLVIQAVVFLGWVLARWRGIAGWFGLSLKYARPVDLLVFFFLLSPFLSLFSGVGNNAFALPGVDTTGRYLLPLMATAPLLVGGGIAAISHYITGKIRLSWSVNLASVICIGVVLVIAFCHIYPYRNADFVTVFQSSYYTAVRPPLENKPVIEYLKSQGVEYYTCNHWVGNRLMLDARETIKCVDYYDVIIQKGPERFPEHTKKLLEPGRKVGFLLVNPSGAPTPLEARLNVLGVTFSRQDFNPYTIIIPASRPVSPQEVADQLGYPY